MKILKFGFKFDTFLQGIILLSGAFALILFAMDLRNGWLALTAFCALGIYQFLSAVIWAVAIQEKRRSKHLLHILYYWLGYLPVFGIVACLFNLFDYLFEVEPSLLLVLVPAYIFGVPIFLAFRYFNMTFRDIVKINSLHRSFWDI